MLKAVKDLGEYMTNIEGLNEESILTDSSKLSNTKKMICVTLKRENNNLVFENVHLEDFNQEKANKILFRSFRHGQYGAFLTSVIKVKRKNRKIDHEASIESVKRKWTLWFRKYSEKLNGYELFKSMQKELFWNEDVFKKIINTYKELNDEDIRSCLITIKIRDEKGEKYPSEIYEFAEVFRDNSLEDLFSKHGVVARGKGICAFCGKSDEVMPGSPFAIFTVKKEGFAYNFDRQNSWKQLPICKQCALDLQAAKECIMNKDKLNLSFSLYGYKYFVIPYFILKGVSENVMKEIELRKNEDYRNGLLNAEEDILEIVKDKKDSLSLIFVFYKSKQQFFDIIKYVEDVPPSWINEIYATFHSINQKSLFKENKLQVILGENWVGNFLDGQNYGNSIWKSQSAGKLAEIIKGFFYHREKDKKIFDKSSLNVLANILDVKQIDKKYFVKHMIRAIREEYGRRNITAGKLLSLKSLYLFDFLLTLGLIPKDDSLIKFKEATFLKKNLNVEKFFDEFSSAFDYADKKAMFLEGVLVSFLLDVQYARRKETPFRNKLHGLKLNKRLVKRLFPEIIEKLKQYDANYYSWLEALISKYFIESDENGWRLSDDEISYYFTLGLNLGKIFKKGDEK
jgi:CRISPR-associated protein Csh1